MAIKCMYVALIALAATAATAKASGAATFDVAVYSATPSGVMAAVSAARNGMSTVLLNPVVRVGGMCSGGLSRSDIGHSPDAVIGGLAREFFVRNAQHYNKSATQPQYMLEPHVAQQVFLDMLAEANVTVWSGARLLATNKASPSQLTGVTVTAAPFTGLARDGRTSVASRQVEATVFVDASYGGDLLAAAGVSYTVGREANTTYDESLAGRQYYSPKNQFYVRVNPYDEKGQLLPLMYGGNPGVPGQGDNKVSAYNFRLCVTKDPANKVPWTKPARYNSSQYELFRRYAAVVPPQLSSFLGNTAPTINGKYDLNNGGPLSTDFIGASWTYPDADYEERQTIWQAHMDYTQGLMWFLASDPSLSAAVRAEMNDFGLCKDEFVETDHWPHQLYVREARRMVGPAVFTQHNATAHPSLGDASIGCGGYNFDSHNVQRIPCANDTFHCEPLAPANGIDALVPSAGAYAMDEGDVEVWPGFFEIPVGVLFPHKYEASNLLVSLCVSSSHIGYSSLRLEPQYMIMGHSAGTLAATAIKAQQSSASGPSNSSRPPAVVVQDVDLAVLNKELHSEGQILVNPPQPH